MDLNNPEILKIMLEDKEGRELIKKVAKEEMAYTLDKIRMSRMQLKTIPPDSVNKLKHKPIKF